MFPNSASLAALALATLAAFPPVFADAASDAAAKKAAEADLVKNLRLAPLATDRIALLSTDDQFAFDFFDPAAAATVGKGGKIVTANAATFPAVIGTNSAMAAGLLDACSMNTPHTHPRATEMQFSVNGTIRTGMITENTSRFILTELPPGSMTIFPMGSIHFQVNDGCEPILFVSTFNSEDPGALQIAQRFLGLPPDIVGATLGDLGVEEVQGLESQIPDNVAIGTDACLKRCGITRPTQPTLQRQPRVSGNAFPSSGTTTTTETYAYNTPPAQSYTKATATMTHGTSTWTTVYTSYAGTPAPTYAASPLNHIIKVGADGLTYTPSNISAAVGDTVTFEFHPKNHTVTQSSFLHPCEALAETSTTGEVGFKSGFHFVAPNATEFPTFNITITDTAPIWGYCGQQGPPRHCADMGMVFSINAVESGPNNFAAFQALALASGKSSSSGYSAQPYGSSAKVTTTTKAYTYSTPPAQSYTKATATMTHGTSTWTTVYTSYAGTPAPTYAANPVNHLIKVGANGLTYSPSNISASIGDTVTFEFHQKNHTVTQSSFLSPCKPLLQTSAGGPGFKSGFQFVAPNVTSNFPTFNITINNTEPIWGYCGQTGHCEMGMVFSINAVESGPNNFAAFQHLANTSLVAAPVAGDLLAAAAAADSNTRGGGGSKTPSPALIALLAINGTLVIGLIVLGGLYIRKRNAANRVSHHKQLYTSISVSGDPIFAAPTKLNQYEDDEGHRLAGDDGPLTHGLTHGPYYDPHEPGSRPHSRSPSRQR
ncbi:hypothetical protein C8F04DRAFT_1036217 [Mycena alexandri]|uniref:Cupin type-1 domain-containing protein n=1 Tax=Mycena alexandri TaxID=1745969 RepID=A0AAD6T3K3_9AGAR|nr:hypothetical protein C8F04DRAFT_1036217 [Mycena alexandri]